MSQTKYQKIETVDVSGCESAEAAAKATEEKLRELADSIGQKGEIEVFCQNRDGVWVVGWEGGPSEWAYNLTAGRGVFGENSKIQGLLDGDAFGVECEYSFMLGFYDL